jgi:hypothetical protein
MVEWILKEDRRAYPPVSVVLLGFFLIREGVGAREVSLLGYGGYTC